MTPMLPARSRSALLFACLAGCQPAADDAPAPAEEPARTAPALKPFEDVASTRPEATASADPNEPFAGTGLQNRPLWKQAQRAAVRAEGLYQEAVQAHRDGDRSLLNARGAEAKALFNRALEDTAEFEAELLETYGERDASVEAIMAERSVWFDRLRWLHKTVGGS